MNSQDYYIYSQIITTVMGFADEIMREFLDAHPDAAGGRWSQEELNQKLSAFMQNRNRKPVAGFDGLSAEQMHLLLNDPFGHGSIIRRHPTPADATIDQIPFFVLIEILYGMLSNGPIKLTPKGNLPVSVCRELYERKLLIQDDIQKGYTKKISEDNVAFIQALKACILISPDVKKRGNALSLTQSGQKSLSKERNILFWQVFDTYTTQFNWAYLDHADAQIGQFGWAYSIYLLHRYGAQEKEAGFYASKVIQAFPHLQEPVPSTRFEGFNLEPALIYRWRFVEHFAGWFGLIEIRKGTNDVFDRQAIIQKAAIFSELFQVDAQKGSVK